ncbi:50S ribosomal protein L34e [Candidatus Woesearchaeota archaeon]|nr:50S ribosomal protein L34e [Candidatus Woesearchaeota archaeon]
MPRPSRRSRSLRRVHIRIPSGISKLVYKKGKPKKALCGKCGAVLHGMMRERPTKMQNLPKSQKRPERKYGGVLCPSCTKRKIISDVRTV